MPKTRTIVVERTLPGPIDRVWDHLTRAELLARWLGRGEIGAVGAPVRIVQDEEAPYPSGGAIVGEVVVSDPPHVLEYTWSHIGEEAAEQPRSSVVRFELSEEQGDVKLRISHSGLWDEDISLVNAGWITHTEFLIDLLTGRPPEPFMDRFRQHHTGPIPGEDRS